MNITDIEVNSCVKPIIIGVVIILNIIVNVLVIAEIMRYPELFEFGQGTCPPAGSYYQEATQSQ